MCDEDEIFEFLEEDYRSNSAKQKAKMQRSILRNTVKPFDMPENAFVKRYRLTKELALDLCNELRAFMPRPTKSTDLSIEVKVLLALSFYATGSYQRPTGDIAAHSVAQQTVSTAIATVTECLNHTHTPHTSHFRRKYIKFPTSPSERRATVIGRSENEDDNLEDDNVSKKSKFTEKRHNYADEERNPIILSLITAVAYVLAVLTWPFTLCKVFEDCKKYRMEFLHCDPYERAVVLRVGRKLPGELKGPGRVTVFPWIDDYWVIDLRTVAVDVPPQEVLTRDSVSVAVDAVIFYKIHDPMSAIMQVEDPINATSLMAVTALRNEIGNRELSQVLSEREQMMASMQKILDDVTKPWGIEVERVDIKNVRLPPALQKAMAAEAEATRETKAKIIASEGEVSRAKALIEASASMMDNPTALQLRYLQSLNEISTNKDSTIVFPFPMDFLESFQSKPAP